MRRGFEDLFDRRGLHHLAAVHHDHPVHGFGHHAEIVGDHYQSHPQLVAQFLDELQDLGLDGDVERRGRLVGEQHAGAAGERHRDHRALEHAAGQLVRVAVEDRLRVADLDPLQKAERLGPGRLAPRAPVRLDRLHDLVADGIGGIEGRHRVLEDHRGNGATEARQVRPAHAGHLGAGELEPVGLDHGRRGFQQPEHGHAGHRLARAALADDAEALAVVEVDAHAAHGLHGAFELREADPQVLDLDQAGRCGLSHRGVHWVRGPGGLPPGPVVARVYSTVRCV